MRRGHTSTAVHHLIKVVSNTRTIDFKYTVGRPYRLAIYKGSCKLHAPILCGIDWKRSIKVVIVWYVIHHHQSIPNVAASFFSERLLLTKCMATAFCWNWCSVRRTVLRVYMYDIRMIAASSGTSCVPSRNRDQILAETLCKLRWMSLEQHYEVTQGATVLDKVTSMLYLDRHAWYAFSDGFDSTHP